MYNILGSRNIFILSDTHVLSWDDLRRSVKMALKVLPLFSAVDNALDVSLGPVLKHTFDTQVAFAHGTFEVAAEKYFLSHCL